jgi:vacuolar-type H+-ATPase subunit I/STV1
MLFHAHSGLRYLVLLFGVLALLYAVVGVVRKSRYDRPMFILGMGFASLLHLQIVLGLGVLLVRPFYPALLGHILMMLMAAAAVQIPLSVMKRRPVEERTFLPIVVGIGVGLLFVVGGILAIGRPVLGTGG